MNSCMFIPLFCSVSFESWDVNPRQSVMIDCVIILQQNIQQEEQWCLEKITSKNGVKCDR